MLRKFKIAIDGKEYLVEMEEIGAPAPATPAPVSAQPAPAPVVETVETPAPAAPIATGSTEDAMTAPMPGTILRILVNPGEAVKENQTLMVLEAMKMENAIVASKDGVVSAIHVGQGDMVNPGDALITIN